MVDLEVVKVSYVLRTNRVQVLKMMNGEVILISGRRIAVVFNSLQNNIRREAGY